MLPEFVAVKAAGTPQLAEDLCGAGVGLHAETLVVGRGGCRDPRTTEEAMQNVKRAVKNGEPGEPGGKDEGGTMKEEAEKRKSGKAGNWAERMKEER